MTVPGSTVVVGASLAGMHAAAGLRSLGHDGPITVVGAEAHRPYDRPPLSKQLLVGKVGVDDLALPVDGGAGVDLLLGRSALGVDLGRRLVTLDGDEPLRWDSLVIATGAAPVSLPGAAPGEVGGVFLLRTLDDSLALRGALSSGSAHVVVVGGGVIGLEVASSARLLGCEVTVIEAAGWVLSRLVGPALGEVVAGLHTGAGVAVRCGVGVSHLVDANGGRAGPGATVAGVALADGSVVAADVVVVGIGVRPSTGWLAGSGVDVDDGVRCDSRLRVLAGGRPVPGVVAAGDVVRWDRPGGAGAVRVEHWTNAVEQGRAAAAALVHGDGAPEYDPVPYVWSDQHGKKLQLVGWPAPGDEVALVDGSYEDRRFAVALGRDGRLTGGFGMGRPAKVMALSRAIADGGPWPPLQD